MWIYAGIFQAWWFMQGYNCCCQGKEFYSEKINIGCLQIDEEVAMVLFLQHYIYNRGSVTGAVNVKGVSLHQ